MFISQEIAPYTPENSMAELSKRVPQLIQENGAEIRVFMPKWGIINERRGQLHEVIRLSGMNIIIDDTDHPLLIKVATIAGTRVQVYFIDNDDYFGHRRITADEQGQDYEDNGERSVFFCRGTLETVKKLRWIPDIIHVSGVMAAIVPLYLKTAYEDEPSYNTAKIITTVFPNTLNAPFEETFKKFIEFRNVKADTLKKYADTFDYTELMKVAIDYSDAIIAGADGIDEAIIDYVKASNKPFLPCPDEEHLEEEYLNFYNSVQNTQ